MRIRLRPGLFVAGGEDQPERADLVAWARRHEGFVFHLRLQDEQTVVLHALGPREQACREPVNIVFDRTAPPLQLISNLAATPFELAGRRYRSVEAFWQGLKHPDDETRARIAELDGHAARRAGGGAPTSDVITYEGRSVRVGTHEHWALMEAACRAKFAQHEAARAALLSTGERPLTHRVRRDSRTIPGVVMAEIWMRIRRDLTRNA